jgi:SAM-dependent methyltransferase
VTAVDYDAELVRYGPGLRRAWGVRPQDRVLDVGCGAGRTTRDAARAAHAGSALGVDVSAPAIERARVLAREEGPPNVAFERADAGTHPFAPAHFDLVISRFGTMFFDDPVAALGNVGRALRPGGRLVMAVWQSHDRNEWDVVIHRAFGGPTPAHRPDPFSLSDPTTIRSILRNAGFADIGLTELCEPLHFGPDVPAARAWVRGFACTADLVNRLGPQAAAGALARLDDALAAHLTDGGVWLDSRAWIVTAHRP